MKIFCIGFNKTGTRSLHHAFLRLGIRSQHNIKKRYRRRFKSPENPSGDVFREYDAFSDIHGMAREFRDLDNEFPNSKFILNTRDRDDWIKSRIGHIEKNRLRQDYTGGWLEIDVDKWVADYEEHHSAVMDYFKDRPDDLLIFNVTAGDSYAKLCPFLGVPVVEESFPHMNLAKASTEQ